MTPETPQSPPPGDKLNSWKEISAWLGVNVRTAQKWESESGMPVLRAPGSNRVTAYTGELTAWLHGGYEAGAAAARQRSTGAGRRNLLALSGLAAVLLVAAAIRFHRPSRELADWRVENSALIALDAKGGELWRFALGRELNASIYKRQDTTPAAWIDDVDGDGRRELLFCHHYDGASHGDLICFSESGKEKWRWTPGRSAASFPEEMSPPYFADRVRVLRWNGHVRILVTAIHHTWFACQFAMLDGQGRQLAEYWHAGHILAFLPLNLPGYSEPLIVAAGIANGYGAADLIVLSPPHFGGASREESPRHQIPAGAPRELARLLFPGSCINRVAAPFAIPDSVRIHDERIEVSVRQNRDGEIAAAVLFAFRPDWSLASVGLSSNYEIVHASLERRGVLTHRLDKRREEEELSAIRWLTPPDRLRAMLRR